MSTPRMLTSSGTGFHRVCHDRWSSLGLSAHVSTMPSGREEGRAALSRKGAAREDGAGARHRPNSPHDGAESQHHLKLLYRRGIDGGVVRGCAPVPRPAVEVVEDGEAGETYV